MPYKTKDGRLVNEVTLGDGYPLSNNLQPIKVAGEASPIEVSKALPDESNNAKVKITGDLEVTGTTKGISSGTVDLTSDVTGVLPSANLDSDTAHLSGTQTFTGEKTFSTHFKLNEDMNFYLGNSDNNDFIYSDGSNINISKDDSDLIRFTDSSIKVNEASAADSDTSGFGQLWVKNDTPNNLYFTNDAGNDVQITNGSSLASGSGGATDHYMDWHYNFANLSSTNTFYANTHIDDFGVSSSINTGISNYSDTEASDIWRIIRHGKRIPYSGTITKVITHVESTGASADSDIEVGVWIASISGLSLDTQLATTTNVAIDNLAKIDFDFDTATRIMLKETTSFNATSLTASDFMFITLRRTSGTDGSSFNCHTTVLYEGS
tara:strand:+ start:1404 stop:2540 length:1137 start_codon:yes stop_codon:yes gene_type:complete